MGNIKIPSLTLTGTEEVEEEHYFIQPVINVGRGATNDLILNNETCLATMPDWLSTSTNGGCTT
ncbi:MAG: hypothetical protein HC806_08110 [Anaerolineae bacterium]|nr:hypothetical protein [Anaerolineae bacterium]